MIRKYGATVLGSIGVALWLAALYLLASAAQNSAEFDRWLPWILLINICGLLTLFVLPSMYHVIEHWAEQRHGQPRWGR